MQRVIVLSMDILYDLCHEDSSAMIDKLMVTKSLMVEQRKKKLC